MDLQLNVKELSFMWISCTWATPYDLKLPCETDCCYNCYNFYLYLVCKQTVKRMLS